MIETEVKILEIDRKEVEDKLISIGAKKVFDDKVNASFFDFEDGSLKKSGTVLRLRTEGKKAVLTLKEPIKKGEAKIKEESEIEVSDLGTTKKILESLGLRVWRVAKKHRTTYSLEGVHFELDNYIEENDFIPEFLEIEAKTLEEIYKFVEALGFSKEDCKPWSLKDLVKHYSK